MIEPTPVERRLLRRLPSLLIPFQEPPDLAATEQPAIDAERQRLEKEIAEIERRYPELAARENARLEREERVIRRRVFGRDTTRGGIAP